MMIKVCLESETGCCSIMDAESSCLSWTDQRGRALVSFFQNFQVWLGNLSFDIPSAKNREIQHNLYFNIPSDKNREIQHNLYFKIPSDKNREIQHAMCCQSVAAEKQLGRVRPMWHKTDTSELDQLRKKQTLLNLWQYIFSGQRLLLVHSRKSFVHGLMTSMQSTKILLCLRPFFHSEEQTLKHPNSWASLLLTKKVLGADVFTSHKI